MPDLSSLATVVAVRIILILLLSLIGGRLLGHGIRKYGGQYARATDSFADDYFVKVIGHAVEWVSYLLGLLTVLSVLNVNIMPFLTGAGFVGVVLGLAAREYLANIIAGLVIIFDKPFSVGDRILLPKSMEPLGDFYFGEWGDVISIGLRSTKVLTVDGVILSVPNSMLTNDAIIDFSHPLSQNLRVRVRIGVHPTPDNVKKALALLRELVSGHELVRNVPGPPQIIIRHLTIQEALLEARFYVEEPWQIRPVRSDIFERFVERGSEQQILLGAEVQRVYLHGPYETSDAPWQDGPPDARGLRDLA